MRLIKDLITKLTKKSNNNIWLSYYSKEERKIEFSKDTIYDFLCNQVGVDKDFYALNYFGYRMTYNELFDKIDDTAKSLKVLGVKPKDIVTICMPNTPEAVIAFYAINKIGAVADMIHPLSSEEEIMNYLIESKSKIMFLVDFNYTKINKIINKTNITKIIMLNINSSMPIGLKIGYQITKGIKNKKPKLNDNKFMNFTEFILKGITYNKGFEYKKDCYDPAVILHSGGTTGKSKGVLISNYAFNALAMQGGVNVQKMQPKDKIVTILPIFHGFGLGVCIHCPLSLKVETILVPEYDSKRFHNMLKKEKPQLIAGVPTLWEGMMDNNYNDVDFSNLKYMVSGGDMMSISMENRINKFLKNHGANIKISKGYGMTESTAAVVYTFDDTNEPGSIGIPMIGNHVKIIDTITKEEVEDGTEGEIIVNSPTLMIGYHNNDEETKKAFTKDKFGKTWFYTGDLGYIAKDGLIYFTQRLKRMIVTSGFNVYPSRIEEIIESHYAVKKCCVVGKPHPYKMEVAKAIIVLKNNKESYSKIKKEIKELCRHKLALYSQPYEIEFVKFLPKTLYNKVDFKKLEQEERIKYEKK